MIMDAKEQAKEQLALLKRGVVEMISEAELLQKLEKSLQTGKALRIKLGVDPTAPDIHLGFTVVMRKLAQFQKLGHQVILIVGDYTATVGDPSGKSKTRPMLTHAEVLENAKHYQSQFFQIVDESKTEVVYNGKWFSKLSFDEVTKLMSQITVAQMLEREDFQNRYKAGNPISLHEFLYPLMQGYDSVMIDADVEIGGTDQKFNVLRGRELQKASDKEAQIGLFMPILLGTDGKEKMSKSLGNYVGVNEPADVMYHKIYNIPDHLIENWFLLLTDISTDDIAKMLTEMQSGAVSPQELKSRLAIDIVSQYHGHDKAMAAAEAEKAIHSGNAIPSDAKEIELAPGEYAVLDMLTTVGAFSSKGEARRMVQNGGVKLAGEKISDPNLKLQVQAKQAILIQVGKRQYFKVNF